MRHRPSLPRTVWILGFVSLATDLGSELAHSLLPLYLVGTLGASPLLLGWIEGLAEATALSLKVFAGTLSDALGKRKPLIVCGYGLSTLAKPLFPLASTVALVAGARVLDRVGKGIRGAPRDALLADATKEAQRGAAYGLRQALDTIGAVLGPLLALLLMLALGGDARAALWVACIPGLFAVALLVFALREPSERRARAAKGPFAPTRENLRVLRRTIGPVVLLGALLHFARSTEAFLLLRAGELGASGTLAPLFLVEMSLVYALAAYPAGVLFDRGAKRGALLASLVALAAAHLCHALADELLLFALGVALYGLHLGLSQGVLAAWIAQLAPLPLRGTAFGVFHLVGAGALLASGASFGWAWQSLSPSAAFGLGALAALLALPLAHRIPSIR
ncbi:MAG: MFS transporter [Planctomycetes bacterium]|nr:MFS transporter [Planctomycetota bacterium]